MIKLLSLIGTLSMGSSVITPIISNSMDNILKVDMEETIDLSILNNYWEIQHLDYRQFYQVETYKEQVIPAMIKSVLLREYGIWIEDNWVKLATMINVIDGREIADIDISGDNGASKETWIAKVVPTEIGKQNGLYNETYTNVTIHFESGDLSLYNKTFWNINFVTNPLNLEALHNETTIFFNDRIYKNNQHNALFFIFKGGQYSKFYIYDQNLNRDRLATQQDLEKAYYEEGKIKLSAFLIPNNYGKEKGIYGSAYVSWNLQLR